MSKLHQGGYDDGYASSQCFWGKQPGSLVRQLAHYFPSFENVSVLDAGCGEGKNAYWLADRGARVLALDISPLALSNAIDFRANNQNVTFLEADFTKCKLGSDKYDICIAYGLLHCLPNESQVAAACDRLKYFTKPGGYLVICTINSRRPIDTAAHPFLNPCLLAHSFLCTDV